jgi:NAD(P)-dependent dehydrogenase (short-subunit alcohol dehydrogenase family)
MFEKGLLKGKRILITGGGSGLGAAMGRRFLELGAELVICGRRLELLEVTAADMLAKIGGKVGVQRCDIRDGAQVEAMMDAVWRDGPIDVLINNAGRDLHRADRAAVFSCGGCDSRADLAWHDVLHARRRQALDRRPAQGRGALDPFDLDHHRACLHRAVGDGEVRDFGDDQKSCGRMGAEGHPHRGDRTRRFPTPGATGQLRPEGRDSNWAARNPLGRAGEHRELADLASYLISDGAAYINGEMVVQDGGSHLRSSGAEDLLQWTDAQWEAQRAARARG